MTPRAADGSAIRFQALIVAFVLGAAALWSPTSGVALPKKDEKDPDRGLCGIEVVVETTLRTAGAYLPGATIAIQADPPTIKAESPLPSNPHLCAVSREPVPTGNWIWQIAERPPLGTSELAGTNGTTVTLLLDQVGVYKVRFIPCAFGCEIELPNNTIHPVDSASREITIRVLAILPPEKGPVLPPSALGSARATNVAAHCPWHSDILSAAWRTVEPWSGPGDYKLLEGEVRSSTVAHADNNLNHRSMDWNIHVVPDPRHRGLLNGLSSQTEVEIEWERHHLPETYRPTNRDRVSAIGYWIYDCGHGARTEIHPPVLLAVHRPRAVAIPASAGAGTNGFVPGIVTDIWVNQEAGHSTDDCPNTGLYQQLHPSKPLFDAQERPIVRCLPDSEGFSRNPINRVFEFTIFLPRSPQVLMAALGRTAPPVPLFREVSNPDGSQGPDPTFEEVTEGAVTYLRVRIDLSGHTQQTYSRRIVSGWAHAAPDNWGARRWNVRVTSLVITDDADLLVKGAGDWRFWVNTNNGTSEWAKLFDCNACAEGREDFEGTPWETNELIVNHRLGPGIVLFPNQELWVATSGFEDDAWYEDSIAPVQLRLGQMQVADGQAVANNGSGKYTMHYQVLPGVEVGGATLSPSAQARYDAYSLTDRDVRGVAGQGLAVLQAVFNAGTGKPRQRMARPGETEQSDPASVEGMSVEQLRQKIQRAAREHPVQLDAFFQEVRRVTEEEKAADGDEEVYQFLEALKPAVPPLLWRKHRLDAAQRATRKEK